LWGGPGRVPPPGPAPPGGGARRPPTPEPASILSARHEPWIRRVVRIEVEHRFGVSFHEGFDYMTEPANWPAYWPRFVPTGARPVLRAPGGRQERSGS
jgi:hypothetical protein